MNFNPGSRKGDWRVGEQKNNIMYRSSSHYGWKPDLPDQRDFQYAVAKPTLAKLPKKIDLTPKCPPVYDQGQLGSCTGNAIAAAFQFEMLKQHVAAFIPSRLFIYYNERSIENTINVDNGAQIRDGIKSIAKLGVCPETMWPYITSEFTHKPYAECYANAMQHRAIKFQRVVRDIEQMKGCLAEGNPFVVGFTVYNSFESSEMATTGILEMPKKGEAMVGGHAVLVVGYDDSSKRFIVRNSWGANWGKGGYFTMPYKYLLDANLSDDFWTIQLVSTADAAKQPGERFIESNIKPGMLKGGAEATNVSTISISVKFKEGIGEINGNIHRDYEDNPESFVLRVGDSTKTFQNVSNGDFVELETTSGGKSVEITIDRHTNPSTPYKLGPTENQNFYVNL